MWEFLFLLLPLAALSGWLIGRRASMRQAIRRLAGLNKLLDHSSNKKAVDVLVQLMDSNQEAVETHLALGGLFRRQGEVDDRPLQWVHIYLTAVPKGICRNTVDQLK